MICIARSLSRSQPEGHDPIKHVEAALGVSQATAILLLREMTRDGLLEKRGTAKNLRYYLAET